MQLYILFKKTASLSLNLNTMDLIISCLFSIHGDKQSGVDIDVDQSLNKMSKTSGRYLPWK